MKSPHDPMPVTKTQHPAAAPQAVPQLQHRTSRKRLQPTRVAVEAEQCITT